VIERDKKLASEGRAGQGPPIFQRATLCLLTVGLAGMPFLALLTVDRTRIPSGPGTTSLLALWWSLWAMLCLLVGLDSARILEMMGCQPDPFGPQALSLSAAALANMIIALTILSILS
jgi:hypothetical protein